MGDACVIGELDGPGWPAGRAPADEGLREWKKRLMRQRLSDTATEMFM